MSAAVSNKIARQTPEQVFEALKIADHVQAVTMPSSGSRLYFIRPPDSRPLRIYPHVFRGGAVADPYRYFSEDEFQEVDRLIGWFKSRASLRCALSCRSDNKKQCVYLNIEIDEMATVHIATKPLTEEK